MKKTAVVILNYNGKHHLEHYLPSVIEFSAAMADIYVIDNGSTDDSISFLEENHATVSLIKLSQNLGFAGGYNEGLKSIKSKYYILLNSDVRPSENWINILENHMENNASTGICVGKIKSDLKPDYFEYAGAAGGFLDRLGYAFCRGRILDTLEKDEGQYDNQRSIAWASGCALLIRADLFHHALGFDATYFAHYEEIDLCWRIRRMGYNIDVLPRSVVYHLGGGTLQYSSTNKVYLNFRNSLFTLYKNADKPYGKLFSRLSLDGVAAIQFLLKLQPAKTWAILKSHVSFYWLFGRMMKRKRAEKFVVEKYSIGPKNEKGTTNESLIWSYFFKNMKLFSQYEINED